MQATAVGQRVERSIVVDEERVRKFGDATGDLNPVHFDPEFAATTPFGRPIVHGGLLIGFFSRILGMELPGPGTIFLSQSVRFAAPVYVGETVVCSVELAELLPKNGARLTTEAKVGDRVVATGEATVKLPRPKST